MTLTFDAYWPLALLSLVPFVWWMPGHTLTNFNRRQMRVQAAARAAIVAFVSLALAGPVLHRTTGELSLVFAVDVSESVAPASIAEAARWIEEAGRAGRAGASRVLAFGGDVRAVGGAGDLTALASGAEARTGSAAAGLALVDRQATNLEAAMTGALASFAPGHVRHLVLFTDGRPTRGDVAAGVARLQQDGVRVFTVPLAERLAGDAWVDAVAAPARATADEPFGVAVTVFSQIARSGVIELRRDGRTVATETVSLQPGATTVSLDARLSDAGAQALDVELTLDGDPESENNRQRVPIVVAGRPRVLYVEGRPASAGYLTRALEAGGFDVDQRTAEGVPVSAGDLAGYAAIILSDVQRRTFRDRQMDALERYVADLGGGLIMAGGEAMYGVDGYADTPIERLLPATFSMKDRPDEFAMVIVLDKSWSMVGEKIELAKEAARAALEVLPDRHDLGVITFNDAFEWAVPLQPAENRADIARRIRAIVPSGHTNLFPAVEEAHKVLAKAKAGVKHVFILSDGRTYPDEYETLVKKMVADKVSVSSVAVGAEADRELLASLAGWGRGRSYSVDNPADVPQVFVKETERAIRSTFAEAPFRPSVRKPVELFAGLDFAAAPPLAGYARMQAKDTSELLLATGPEDELDPILARWQYGLGRSAVFTSDVKDRWARGWIAWSGYGKFWTQLVREIMRRDDPAGTAARPALSVRHESGRAIVETVLVGEDGAFRDLAALDLEVVDPQGRASTAPLAQVGPGTYRAAVPLEARGGWTFRLRSDGEAEPLAERQLVVDEGGERRFWPPDVALLDAIARDTGGALDPAPEDVFDVGADRAPTATALWPLLSALAALVWLGDLGLRRVRLFEGE